ncbi:MAG: hypothetical protein HYZ79_04025 [Candidatus Melainabacteria bacterium]|nr:hypothetical protein [Candidatus Melainabacteria bacterium]
MKDLHSIADELARIASSLHHLNIITVIALLMAIAFCIFLFFRKKI